MRERVVAAIAEDRIGTVLLDCYVKLIENKEGAAGNCLSQASNNCLSQEYSPMHMTTTPRQSLSGKKLSMSETLQSQVLPV